MIAAVGGRGRPLRFLGAVTGGWVGLRVVLLWPTLETPADVLRAVAPGAHAAAAPAPVMEVRAAVMVADRTLRRHDPIASGLHVRARPDPGRLALALLGLIRYGGPQSAATATPVVPGLPRALPPAIPGAVSSAFPSRWSGSVWLVARGGAGLVPGTVGGQLGGSQAGVRIAYLLDRRRHIALAGRVTTPLGRGLREAALGVEWQPTRAPVRLVVEQRFAIDAGKSGPALGIVGGFEHALPLGFRLEAYGQAGVIRRDGTQAFLDGAARVARPVATFGAARIDLGAGLWGGAQRGAARLDIGPSLGVTVPLARQPVRFSLDWRQRVAGDARPGSGPALTLGTDF